MTTIQIDEQTDLAPEGAERTQFVSGLMALARLMRSVPEVPIPTFECLRWHFPLGGDIVARPVFDATVAALTQAGIPFAQEENARHWKVTIELDGLTVEIVHPSDQAMAKYHARMSYANAIQVDAEQGEEVPA
ncbi:hypothetical protein ABZ897_00380 [Nonomuraea sp. NPDC046802]|uniref:hypothetical protein n=1 Tax=Nonomuraea sp. NPDC046802 TaxID=3154919 RepID=UPI0033DFA17A